MRFAQKAIFALGLLVSSAAYAGAPGWSLSETSGQVTVVSTGLVKAATRGGTVAAGDVINTGRNGRAVLVRGEEYLVVAPNSRIRVAEPAKTGGLTQIIENFGNVIYKIKKMTMPHFAVETPFLAAVVKGTTFSVTVTDKGASVQVIEGKVEVATRDGGASYLVLPGDIGSVNGAAPGSLNVQGRETRTITSPTPAVAAAAVTASLADHAAAPDQVQLSGVIETPVSEGSVNIEAMSDGMVTGDPAMVAMASMTKTASLDTQTTAPVEAAANPEPVTSVAVVAPLPAPVAVVAPAPAPAAPVVVVAAPPAPVIVAAPPAPAAPVVVAAPPAPAAPVVVVAAPPAPTPLPPVVVVAAPMPAPAPAPAPPTVIQAIVAALPGVIVQVGDGNNQGQNNQGDNNQDN